MNVKLIVIYLTTRNSIRSLKQNRKNWKYFLILIFTKTVLVKNGVKIKKNNNNNDYKKYIICTFYVYCATYIQAGQDLRVPLWYRAPLDHPRNIADKSDRETKDIMCKMLNYRKKSKIKCLTRQLFIFIIFGFFKFF